MLAEHVWEHLSIEDGVRAAKNCYKYLQPGGYIRSAVPDGNHPDAEYINQVKVNGTGAGADDHKVLYTYQSFKKVFEDAGFAVNLLEYFDENGSIHVYPLDPARGIIWRSSQHDRRSRRRPLTYTSIIIDAVKK